MNTLDNSNNNTEIESDGSPLYKKPLHILIAKQVQIEQDFDNNRTHPQDVRFNRRLHSLITNELIRRRHSGQ